MRLPVVHDQGGITAAVGRVTARRKAVLMLGASPDNRRTRSTKFQRMAHTGTILFVYFVADGMTQYRPEHAANNHAHDPVVPAGNLTADHGTRDAADDRPDFISIALSRGDAVIVNINDTALALVMLGLFVLFQILVIVAILFIVAMSGGMFWRVGRDRSGGQQTNQRCGYRDFHDFSSSGEGQTLRNGQNCCQFNACGCGGAKTRSTPGSPGVRFSQG
jgi:hypothetical protein